MEQKLIAVDCLKNASSHKRLCYETKYERHYDLQLLKKTVFWDAALCSLVEVYRRFRGACWLHHQSDTALHGATSQNTVILILATVRTWNLKTHNFHLKHFPYGEYLTKCKYKQRDVCFQSVCYSVISSPTIYIVHLHLKYMSIEGSEMGRERLCKVFVHHPSTTSHSTFLYGICRVFGSRSEDNFWKQK
jgi:hypothetical protein